MNLRFLAAFGLAVSTGACISATSSSETAASDLRTDNRGDDDDDAEVDPTYVGDWVVAPGATGDFAALNLRADGTYSRTNSAGAKAEAGTWGVIYHPDWDWIYNHELVLTAASGASQIYGAELEGPVGYGSLYPSENEGKSEFTVFTQALAATIPATCNVATQNCAPPASPTTGGLGDFLVCVPPESDSTVGTCLTGQYACFASSGCADRSEVCVMVHGHESGICVPRSAAR